MLRLLAQREEGYEDIAALKGMSVEEVRAEVKAALAQLTADREEVVEPAPPPAQPVEPPAPPGEAPKAKRPSPAGPARRPSRPGVPPERRRLLALTGGAVAIVAVVLIAIAVFSGGSDSGSADSGSPTEIASAENGESSESGKVTQAVLEPADGSEASGRAIFGKVGKEEIVLQVTAEGLEPTEDGESYTVWLYRSPKLSLRVGSVPVGDSGSLGARFTIPAELLAYVASGAFDQIYVSRTSDAAYQREVAQAKQNKTLPRYSGETVLSGEITGPVARAANAAGG
jgi:hypothetical protein